MAHPNASDEETNGQGRQLFKKGNSWAKINAQKKRNRKKNRKKAGLWSHYIKKYTRNGLTFETYKKYYDKVMESEAAIDDINKHINDLVEKENAKKTEHKSDEAQTESGNTTAIEKTMDVLKNDNECSHLPSQVRNPNIRIRWLLDETSEDDNTDIEALIPPQIRNLRCSTSDPPNTKRKRNDGDQE
eukprot:227951_1